MYDVIIVGAGNAALCAALAAREHAQKILVLERASQDESGGNSRFTAGLFRLAYRGPEDLKTLIPDLSEQEIANHNVTAIICVIRNDVVGFGGEGNKSAI